MDAPELLAPRTVVFFDCESKGIGTNSYMHRLVPEITGIGDLSNWKEASVAQKMSWASKRRTTRAEDKRIVLWVFLV